MHAALATCLLVTCFGAFHDDTLNDHLCFLQPDLHATYNVAPPTGVTTRLTVKLHGFLRFEDDCKQFAPSLSGSSCACLHARMPKRVYPERHGRHKIQWLAIGHVIAVGKRSGGYTHLCITWYSTLHD